MTTERTEDYLKAIDTIIEKKGYSLVKDIARFLDVSPSSVTGMFKKLTKEGFINCEKYGGVTLAPDGRKLAKSTRKSSVCCMSSSSSLVWMKIPQMMMLAMGVLPVIPVNFVQSYPSYVFDLNHTRYAVDREIAESIFVRLE
ncbi:metal-dependent transcriptional regulator [Methanococcoides burtonii]|uniref:metal-dependent transcriptional regulator n=1 Tax=Methanococcoides burtonii TaxID=29291 RepID=UPI001E2AAD35|nr:metal-dependent transcriptional regulator [Methanococcoides burtonii]